MYIKYLKALSYNKTSCCFLNGEFSLFFFSENTFSDLILFPSSLSPFPFGEPDPTAKLVAKRLTEGGTARKKGKTHSVKDAKEGKKI